MNNNIYTEVTEKIVAMLETGTAPWHKPWSDGSAVIKRPLRSNGKAYKGINTLLLWSETEQHGYQSASWLTFAQAKKEGGHVKKGEKSTPVIFFKFIEIEDKETGEPKKIPLLNYYRVFNADQCENLPEKYSKKGVIVSPAMSNPDKPDEALESFLAGTQAVIRHGGNRAYFSPGNDYVQLPEFKFFESATRYYSVALHELTHWTGHKSRLDRIKATSFGSSDYAKEELVAELGAAFLCSELGINAEPREDHAHYLKSWLRVLKADNKAIFHAASQSESACEYLQSLQAGKSKQQAA